MCKNARIKCINEQVRMSLLRMNNQTQYVFVLLMSLFLEYECLFSHLQRARWQFLISFEFMLTLFGTGFW